MHAARCPLAVATFLVVLVGPTAARAATPEPVDAIREGVRRYESGDVEGALALLQAARREARDPGREAVVCLYLAAAQHRLGRSRESAASLRDAIKLQPGSEIEGRGLSEDDVRRLRATRRNFAAEDPVPFSERRPRSGPSRWALVTAVAGGGLFAGGYLLERGPELSAGPHRPLLETPPSTVQRVELIGEGGIPIGAKQDIIAAGHCATAGKLQRFSLSVRMTHLQWGGRTSLAFYLVNPAGESSRAYYGNIGWTPGPSQLFTWGSTHLATWLRPSGDFRNKEVQGTWALRVENPTSYPGVLHWWRLAMDVEP